MLLLLPVFDVSIIIYFLQLLLSLLAIIMFPQLKFSGSTPEPVCHFLIFCDEVKSEFLYQNFYGKSTT